MTLEFRKEYESNVTDEELRKKPREVKMRWEFIDVYETEEQKNKAK